MKGRDHGNKPRKQCFYPSHLLLVLHVSARTTRKRRREVCVLQRTEETESAMAKIILHDLRSNDEDVLKKAPGDLWQAIYDNDEEMLSRIKRTSFGFAATLPSIGSWTNTLNASSCSQESGIKVLLNASSKNSVLLAAIAKVQGIQAIVAATKRHPADQGIIYSGLGALRNLKTVNA